MFCNESKENSNSFAVTFFLICWLSGGKMSFLTNYKIIIINRLHAYKFIRLVDVDEWVSICVCVGVLGREQISYYNGIHTFSSDFFLSYRRFIYLFFDLSTMCATAAAIGFYHFPLHILRENYRKMQQMKILPVLPSSPHVCCYQPEKWISTFSHF